MPKLIVRREVGWEKKIIRYQVLVDDMEVGSIGQGEEVAIAVSAGRRAVQFRFGRWASRALELSFVEGGRDVLIECGHDPRPLGALLRLLAPGSAIRAKRLTTGFEDPV